MDVPDDRIIDGLDISGLMHGVKADDVADSAFYYYQHTHLQAVRYGKWKLILPRLEESAWSLPWRRHIDAKDYIAIKTPMLIDLEKDIGETINVADANEKVVENLLKLAQFARNDIGDYDRAGRNARFFDGQPRRPDIAKWKKK